MVTTSPRMKHTTRGITTRRALLIFTPMASPMGIMDMSTPRVNRPIPTTSSTAPKRKSTMVPGVRGATVMLITITMAVMGSTEARDSLIFSKSN